MTRLSERRRARQDMRDRGPIASRVFAEVMAEREAASNQRGAYAQYTRPAYGSGARVADLEQYKATEEALTRWMEQNLEACDNGTGTLEAEKLVLAANDQFNLFDPADPTDAVAVEIHALMLKLAEAVLADHGASYVVTDTPVADPALAAVTGAYSARDLERRYPSSPFTRLSERMDMEALTGRRDVEDYLLGAHDFSPSMGYEYIDPDDEEEEDLPGIAPELDHFTDMELAVEGMGDLLEEDPTRDLLMLARTFRHEQPAGAARLIYSDLLSAAGEAINRFGKRDGTVPAPGGTGGVVNAQSTNSPAHPAGIGAGATNNTNGQPMNTETAVAEIAQVSANDLSSEIQGLNGEIANKGTLVQQLQQEAQQLQSMGQNDGMDHSAEIGTLTSQAQAEQQDIDNLNQQLQAKMQALQGMNNAVSATGGTPAQVPQSGNTNMNNPAAAAAASSVGTVQGANQALREMRHTARRNIAPFLTGKRDVTQDQVKAIVDQLQQTIQQLQQLQQAATQAPNNNQQQQHNNNNQQQPPQNQQAQATGGNSASLIAPTAYSAIRTYLDGGSEEGERGSTSTGNTVGTRAAMQSGRPEAHAQTLGDTEAQRLLQDARTGSQFRQRLIDECAQTRITAMGNAGEDEAVYRARIANLPVEALEQERDGFKRIAAQLFSTGRSVVPLSADQQATANGANGSSRVTANQQRPSGGESGLSIYGSGHNRSASGDVATPSTPNFFTDIKAARKRTF